MVKYILLAGIIAGLLDALGAIVTFLIRGGKDPVKIFNFIASGIFGSKALSGGTGYAVLGFIFHLSIATIWTTIFFIATPYIKSLTKNWWLSGLGYGVFVWMGMNLVVVPLSNTPSMPFRLSGMIIGVFVLMICIGLPISYFAYRFNK